MSEPLVVILGGTRSGKSRFGRDRARALAAGGPVTFVATALPGDPELDARIVMHQRDRPDDWQTLEPTLDLPRAIRDIEPSTTILLDGLTLWLSRLIDESQPEVLAVVDGPVEELQSALATHPGPAIVVSDEIGLGLVPLDPVSRAFRDILGIAHQQLVAGSDEAWFMVAGRPIRLPETDPS